MTYEGGFGPLARVFHDLSFRLGTAQQALADVEDLLYRETLGDIQIHRPVFVTALPRSGTTILLRLLHSTSRFASPLYRDVPFVLSPLLWNRFARSFSLTEQRRERAHGDGLDVSPTSPAAIEEMIWKHFWGEHYQDDRIVPWTGPSDNREFNRFFEGYMKKIIALRRDDVSGQRRYLSKNNVHFARLAAPPPVLAGASFLIPFREPIQHAASLLRQHERFCAIHDEDDFVRRYMDALGHHEFGRTLRPIDFAAWLDEAPPPASLEFWLRYWLAAYSSVLENFGDGCLLISYRRLTEEPGKELTRIAGFVNLDPSVLTSTADRLRPPPTHEVNADMVSGEVKNKAAAIHERLIMRSEA